MEDEKIVELFLTRDETAIAAVAGKYGAKLYAIAFGLLGNSDDAEECVNDAYLEAWNRIPPHEPRAYLFAFLAKITRAKALNRVKRLTAEKRSAELVSLTDELSGMLHGPENTESAVDQRALTESINRFLREASEEKRRVFVRRYWYAESLEQIARRYGIGVPKVKSLLWRARRELKNQLMKEGFVL